MIGCLDAGYDKLLKYFNKAERSPAYIAAVVLNPQLKWTVFMNWKEEDQKSAEEALSCLWEDEYRSNTGLPQRITTPIHHSGNTYFQWLAECKTTDDDYEMDELEKYLQADTPINIGNISAQEWWSESSQRAKYPLLSKMAIDILSIPAMSAEVERVFSGAKTTISEGRWRLGIDTIEALQCLKSWFRAGYYTKEELHDVVRAQEAMERQKLIEEQEIVDGHEIVEG